MGFADPVGSALHSERLRGASSGDRGHADKLPTDEHVYGKRAGFFFRGHPTRPSSGAHRERGLGGVDVLRQLRTCSVRAALILRAHVPIRISDHADEQWSTRRSVKRYFPRVRAETFLVALDLQFDRLRW